MKQLKRILVGHDLDVGGEVAMGSAVALANRFGAAIRLVHVVEPLEAYQRISHPLTSPYTMDEITQKTGTRLQALVASSTPARLQVEYEVRKGKPFVELIIAGRTWDVDLIVVGGSSGTEEPFLGGTSERVVRKSLVPVMVAKKILSSEAKRFLVPTDFSSCARKATEEALMLAERFGGRVFFFHALDLASSYTVAYAHGLGVSVPIPPPSPQELEPEWEAFLAGLPLEKVDWAKSTEEGQAATSIVHQAERIQADIIVMGTHGRSGLPHMLLGSVAENVVRRAPCPVLTIRPESFQFEMP
jgi:nucleotide-binding universal stress UspA family protein